MTTTDAPEVDAEAERPEPEAAPPASVPLAPPPTMHIGPELDDTRTHVEKINGTGNPADDSGTGIPH